MDERTIFTTALEQPDARARAVYLDAVCGADAGLRSRVEDLLALHERSGDFLERSPLAPGRTQRIEGDAADPIDNQPRTFIENETSGEIVLDFLAPSDDPGALGSIGQYTVRQVIGRGGMGIVLQARDASLNRVVAIKVLAPELAGNSTARKRFLREARAAAAVVHQHVVTIHAVAEDRPPYLVMEYVDGQSLQDKIDASGPLGVTEVLRIGVQVASGLAAAHANGVIHRDIKPSNILLENGVERVRITDFGLARAADDVEITRPGEVAGTPQYMSPEQAQGQPVDARSDLFSFGCVLYAMCTGRPPFRAESTIAAIRRVCDDTPRPIREVNAETPAWLTEIIDRLLAKRPEDRFQTAEEVADLLGQHLAHVQAPAAHPRPYSLSASPGRQEATINGRARPRWFATALVFLAALTALGVTEATGVTQLAGTVVRIVTGEGTLIIESDDPAVQISLDGEVLTIRGGGVEEVRLRPGQYQFVATKNGQPVKQELVTITRGGENVVTVSREAVAPTIAAPEPGVEPGAFVVLGAAGVHERKFETLADAVLGASDGDTIEVRDNGPFESQPIRLSRSLVIRAGTGVRPVIQLRPELSGQQSCLIQTTAHLTLEGLEFKNSAGGPVASGKKNDFVWSYGAPLCIANCRFVTPWQIAVGAWNSPALRALNSEFLCQEANCVMGNPVGSTEWILDSCVYAGAIGLTSGFWSADDGHKRIRLTRNTFRTDRYGLWLHLSREIDDPQVIETLSALEIDAADNSFDCGSTYLNFEMANPRDAAAAQALLRRLFDWRDQRNLFAGGHSSIQWSVHAAVQTIAGPQSLADWTRFWGAESSNVMEGSVRYVGGDLIAKLQSTPEELTPDDFRLRPDSAGYRAGPDGKDLGADVDLVGLGIAYERWKKTPAYVVWLKETGQMK